MALRELMKIKSLFILIFLFGAFSWPFVAVSQVTENISVTAIVGDGSTPPPSSGGGGAYIPPPTIPKTSVRFSGEAYPQAIVKILEGGVEKSTVQADAKGDFSATFEEEFDQNALYTLFATDTSGERSLLLNYPLALREGYLTHLSGIRFPPTIKTDKSQVRIGEFLEVHGFAYSQRLVEVSIEGGLMPVKNALTKKTFFTEAKKNGEYRMVLPLKGLARGEYVIYAQYQNDSRISKLVRFVIADSNIKSEDMLPNLPGDCNADSKVDLVDFSVLAYWYKRSNPPACVDLNSDSIVDLVDFSILAFYWTGQL